MNLLAFVFVFCGSLKAQNEPIKPGAHKNVVCIDGERTFNLFIPKAYKTKPDKQFPVLYISSPSGNPKFLKLEKWAEEREFLLICINNSKNGPWENNRRAQDSVLQSTAYLRKHHCLQLATGFSGGASASTKFAQRYPKMLAGVLLHSHSGTDCAPGQSVTFIYGAKDKIHSAGSVENAIKKCGREGFHLDFKKLNTGHGWGGLEDTKAMLDFMYDFQRFNNRNLTKADIANDIESELEFLSANDDLMVRESKLFDYLQSLSKVPKLARTPIANQVVTTWSESYAEILQKHQQSPVEAYAVMNYGTRRSVIGLVKGSAQKKLKELLEPILEDETVANEVKAQLAFDRVAKKEAKLTGRESQRKAVVKQYQRLIEKYPDTIATEQAELRIAKMENP